MKSPCTMTRIGTIAQEAPLKYSFLFIVSTASVQKRKPEDSALRAGLRTPSAQKCRLWWECLRTGFLRSEQARHFHRIICTGIHPPGAGHVALRLPQKQELHQAVRPTGDRRAAAHLKPQLHLGAPPAQCGQTRTFRPLPARRACAPCPPCRPRLGLRRQWGRVRGETGPVSGSRWEERGSRSTLALSSASNQEDPPRPGRRADDTLGFAAGSSATRELPDERSE